MSTVKEVMEHYHAKVPFPITPAKIEAAGYDVHQYLKEMIHELMKANDWLDPRNQDVLRKLHLLQRSFQ